VSKSIFDTHNTTSMKITRKSIKMEKEKIIIERDEENEKETKLYEKIQIKK
jgi:hypothetical protein